MKSSPCKTLPFMFTYTCFLFVIGLYSCSLKVYLTDECFTLISLYAFKFRWKNIHTIPTKHKYIHTYLLMLYLLIIYTHSKSSDEYFLFWIWTSSTSLVENNVYNSQQLIVVVFWNDRLENFLLTSTASITNWPKFLNVLLYHWSLFLSERIIVVLHTTM